MIGPEEFFCLHNIGRIRKNLPPDREHPHSGRVVFYASTCAAHRDSVKRTIIKAYAGRQNLADVPLPNIRQDLCAFFIKNLPKAASRNASIKQHTLRCIVHKQLIHHPVQHHEMPVSPIGRFLDPKRGLLKQTSAAHFAKIMLRVRNGSIGKPIFRLGIAAAPAAPNSKEAGIGQLFLRKACF